MKLIALLVAFAASLASATDTTQMELSCEQRLAQIPKIIDEATFQRAARFAASPAARRAAPLRPVSPPQELAIAVRPVPTFRRGGMRPKRA